MWCRRPLRIFQTFSYNFCRCVIQREVPWPVASGQPHEDAQSNRPATLIAMSGSSPSDVELWNLEVIPCAEEHSQEERPE